MASTLLVWHLYLHPLITSPLTRADAVVVLGGTPYDRFLYGIALAQKGLAPQVVLSNSMGENDPFLGGMCSQEFGVKVTCFIPQPWTTRGEAEEVGRLAQAGNWQRIIVVTNRTHISRAAYILQRCFTGEIELTDYPDGGHRVRPSDLIYQTLGWFRAIAQSGC